MSLHPGTDRYNLAGNSDFTRKAEALALGITSWSTPKATDGAKGGPGQSYGSGGTPPLPAQAAQWPTPAAQNWKGSSEASVTRADGKSRMDILHYRAEQGFTRPAPAITMDGAQSSPHAPISRPLVLCCPRLPIYKGATARHAIYGGQWRRLDRCQLGRYGPFQSLISRRLPQGPERIRVRQITHDKHRTRGR